VLSRKEALVNTLNEANEIMNDNFTRGAREKSNLRLHYEKLIMIAP
jgi:hypothetical protein